MRARYSPIMPNANNCTPEKIEIIEARKGNPGTLPPSIKYRPITKARINIHMGTCGIAAGARDILSAVLTEIKSKDIKDVTVVTSGCAGLCSKEPMATVEIVDQAPVKYVELTSDKILKILNDHALGGKIVEEYSYSTGSERVG